MGGVIKATDRFGEFRTRRITDRDPDHARPAGDQRSAAERRRSVPTANPFVQSPGRHQRGGRRPDASSRRRAARAPRASAAAIPGFDTFFRRPAPTTSSAPPTTRRATCTSTSPTSRSRSRRSAGRSATTRMIMGPWLPKNFIRANALNTDRAQPVPRPRRADAARALRAASRRRRSSASRTTASATSRRPHSATLLLNRSCAWPRSRRRPAAVVRDAALVSDQRSICSTRCWPRC